MNMSELDTDGFSPCRDRDDSSPVGGVAATVRHRIKDVRREQGLSLRRVATMLNIEIDVARHEEDPSTDLTLTQLHAWQRVLEVPLADLLVDSQAPLSAPVLQRARMVRIMKTVAAIQEKADSTSIRRLSETLATQLKEIMPELEGVTPWHSVGQRRLRGEFGRVVQRTFPSEVRLD